ncbi:MAG: potassium channel family protein [Chloroflexota bacterium]
MQGTISRLPAIDRDLGGLARPLDVAVIAAALLTIPLTVMQEQGVDDPLLAVADWAIWLVFALDLGVRVWAAHDRWAGLRRHWLSAGVVVLTFPALPALLALMRLSRLTRLARVLRLAAVAPQGLQSVRHILGRQGVMAAAAATVLLILAGAGLLTLLEPESVAGGFWDGVWWGVVTATTVGYGDITPHTPLGRLVAVAIMIAGVGLFSTLAASAAAHFVSQDDNVSLKAVVQRLDEISARLERLERQLDQSADGKTGSNGSQDVEGQPREQ